MTNNELLLKLDLEKQLLFARAKVKELKAHIKALEYNQKQLVSDIRDAIRKHE